MMMYFAALHDEDVRAQKHHYLDNIPFLVDRGKKHLICTKSIEGVGLEAIVIYEWKRDYEVAYFS